VLGWAPGVVLDEGLEKTITYFAAELARPPEAANTEAATKRAANF
jgi:dTDP-D-glucose 4,6-dehydratase